MSWTQTQLDALEAAIGQGALVVQYTDKRVQYRSLDEMLRIRDLMRRSLGLSPSTTRIYPRFSKGLGTCED